MPDAAQPPPDLAPDTFMQMDATAAVFAISPGSQSFGSVTIGVTSSPVNFTVTNAGDLPSDVPAVGVTGDFLISTNGCINPVPSRTSCVVGVAFKPTVAGARSGTLNVTTSGGSTSTATLTGTGVSPVPGQFALKPLAHDFGWKQVGGATGDVIFTLTNTGGNDTAVPVITIGGTDKADFAFNAAALKTGICTMKLAPAGSCTISLHFAPKTASASMMTQKTATLDVTGNPGGSASATLTGNATVANGLVILPPDHDFLNVTVGQQSAPFTFVLSNPSATATVGQITISAVAPGVFAIVLPPPVFTTVADPAMDDCIQVHKQQLGPGQHCNIVFAFKPNAVGLRQLNWQATGSIPGAVPINVQATAHVQGTGQ